MATLKILDRSSIGKFLGVVGAVDGLYISVNLMHVAEAEIDQRMLVRVDAFETLPRLGVIVLLDLEIQAEFKVAAVAAQRGRPLKHLLGLELVGGARRLAAAERAPALVRARHVAVQIETPAHERLGAWRLHQRRNPQHSGGGGLGRAVDQVVLEKLRAVV